MASLTFKKFREVNVSRCKRWHPIESWSRNDWAVALMGEYGEAMNIVKKLNRERDNIVGNKPGNSPVDFFVQLHNEIADIQAYLDLFAERDGLSIEGELIRNGFVSWESDLTFQRLRGLLQEDKNDPRQWLSSTGAWLGVCLGRLIHPNGKFFLASTQMTLMEFAQAAGCDVEYSVIKKFNEVSERCGFPERL